MVVIADTSPLNYLVLVGEVDILPRLYTSILIPQQVLAELERPAAPIAVREWIKRRPEWLIVDASVFHSDSADLLRLGAGERSAIALAEARLPDVILLIDEIRGRNAATIRRIPIIGTLGLLAAAAAHGILDLPAALERLQQTNFHVSAALIERLLEHDQARRRQ